MIYLSLLEASHGHIYNKFVAGTEFHALPTVDYNTDFFDFIYQLDRWYAIIIFKICLIFESCQLIFLCDRVCSDYTQFNVQISVKNRIASLRIFFRLEMYLPN